MVWRKKKTEFSVEIVPARTICLMSKHIGLLCILSAYQVAADLEAKIKQHIQQVHAHRSFQSIPALREMKTATQDLDIVSICQLC